MKLINRLYLLVILGFVLQLPVAAQNILDLAGLDETVNATVAFSVRKLSSNYTGNCMQVRRSSDNATLNIGFTSGGELDISSLLAFVGPGDAFVVIWYDQSGNNKNFTQSSTSNQPRIVNAGNIELENAKPFIRFFGQVNTGAFNSLNLSSAMTTTGHVAIVNKFAVGGDGFILGHATDFIRDWHSNPTANLLIDISNASTSIKNGKYWQNGSSVAPGSAVYNTTLMVHSIAPSTPSSGTRWNNIGSDRNLYHHTNNGGGYSELIAFSSELKTYSRNYLSENQGNYFGIGITPVAYLNRFGQMVTATSEYLNRNGGLGTAGMNSSGATFPRSVISNLPVTTTISSITAYSAISGGSITSDEGANIRAGVCWNTSTNPTILNSKSIDLGKSGNYTSVINGLRGNTTYYVRSYASNYLGTKYGNELSFTTNAPISPIFTGLSTISSIKGTSATVKGNLLSDGGDPLSAIGFCWSITPNPTLSDNIISTANLSSGVFSAKLSNLSLSTTYYVRAYATNSLGTAYGDEVSFTTSATLSVGDNYQGGIIGYILNNTDPGYVADEIHGLIVAENDVLPYQIEWTYVNYDLIGTSIALREGLENTRKIDSACNNFPNQASYYCSNLVLNSYSDWFLPSKEELNNIYINKSLIPNFKSYYYWTSSESSSYMVWVQDFNSGIQTQRYKDDMYYVRPVRSF